MATDQRSTESDKKEEEIKWIAAGLPVPGGLLTGMGLGFLFDEFLGGLFIGLGTGFLVTAILLLWLRER